MVQVWWLWAHCRCFQWWTTVSMDNLPLKPQTQQAAIHFLLLHFSITGNIKWEHNRGVFLFLFFFKISKFKQSYCNVDFVLHLKEIFYLLPSQTEFFVFGHIMYSFHTFFPFVVLVLADMVCHANVKNSLLINIKGFQHAWNTICFRHTRTSPCVLQSIKTFF